MNVDASIPLQVQQFQPATAQQNAMTFAQQLQSAQLGQMKIAEGRRNLRNQILLSQIGAKPGSIDKSTGMWSDDAIGEIANVDPMLGQKLSQERIDRQFQIEKMKLEQSKEAIENRKAITETLDGVVNDSLTEAERETDPVKRKEKFSTAFAENWDEAAKSGVLRDMKRADLDYDTAKKKSLEIAARGKKTPVTEAIEGQEVIDGLEAEKARYVPGSPEALRIDRKIAIAKQALNKETAPTEAGGKGSKYTFVQQQADGSFIGMNKATGKMEKVPTEEGVTGKDRRDVLQADALAAYRARFPMGFMKEVYGKDQPTPEEYVAEYIANKDKGGKGMPKPDETMTRFQADPAMKNFKVGKKTPQGYEVLDSSGKLVGHYQ